MVFHGFDFNRAKASRVRDRCPRHARENHRADHVDLTEAAPHPADGMHRELIDTVRHACNVH